MDELNYYIAYISIGLKNGHIIEYELTSDTKRTEEEARKDLEELKNTLKVLYNGKPEIFVPLKNGFDEIVITDPEQICWFRFDVRTQESEKNRQKYSG